MIAAQLNLIDCSLGDKVSSQSYRETMVQMAIEYRHELPWLAAAKPESA